jgi:peptidoglycan-associated lipoprotein
MKEHDWNVVGCKDVKAPATAVANATPATTGPYTPPPGYALVPVAPVIPNVSPSAGSNALEPSAKDRVFFDYNSIVIKPDGEDTLTRQALWLKQHPDVKVLIEGHCDERGTREYNIALGDRRANAVKNHLQALGVSPDRMETISYGKERPDQLGADENALSQNRRSVTVIPKP